MWCTYEIHMYVVPLALLHLSFLYSYLLLTTNCLSHGFCIHYKTEWCHWHCHWMRIFAGLLCFILRHVQESWLLPSFLQSFMYIYLCLMLGYLVWLCVWMCTAFKSPHIKLCVIGIRLTMDSLIIDILTTTINGYLFSAI